MDFDRIQALIERALSSPEDSSRVVSGPQAMSELALSIASHIADEGDNFDLLDIASVIDDFVRYFVTRESPLFQSIFRGLQDFLTAVLISELTNDGVPLSQPGYMVQWDQVLLSHGLHRVVPQVHRLAHRMKPMLGFHLAAFQNLYSSGGPVYRRWEERQALLVSIRTEHAKRQVASWLTSRRR